MSLFKQEVPSLLENRWNCLTSKEIKQSLVMRQTDRDLGEMLGEKTRDACCWHHEGKQSWRMVLMGGESSQKLVSSAQAHREIKKSCEVTLVVHWGVEIIYSWSGLTRMWSCSICVSGSCRSTHHVWFGWNTEFLICRPPRPCLPTGQGIAEW